MTICIILTPIMAIGKEQKQSAEMGILKSDVWRNKTLDWTAEGKQEEAYFGVVVSTAGDVNGDGYGDVIIGAPGYDNDQDDDGRVFVYYGSASGLSKTADWT
ncbi:FG-GAP repeat protein, partial [candidate division WOR-3 bacterium]|nr:FG-GAP repeat protein [candidate division WOR-3 bacterium]